MPAFHVEALESIKNACEATAVEAADAFSRAFEQKIQLQVGEGGAFDEERDLAPWAQPGLAILLKVNDQAALVMVSVASGLLPTWYDHPDPTGESKLSTLGQELGMTLLPEEFMALEFEVHDVEDLAQACRQGQLGESAARLNLILQAGGHNHEAVMIWPLNNPEAVFQSPAKPDTTPVSEPSAAASPSESGKPNRITDFQELPTYSRTLLHIQVPIRVVLAAKTMKVNDIVSMGLGTIIQFDKSCEDTLDVEIGQQRIAEGEAVKVGDKFGIRVTSIAMPEERYIALKTRQRVR